MSFLYPLFLIAGIAAAIPILIHLYHLRRYKTVYFSSTKFLQSIRLLSKKQSRIQHRLLLTARILFLLFLVLAFAKPYFRDAAAADTAERVQVVFIDNAISTALKMGAGDVLETMKASAKKHLLGLPAGTSVVLLSHDRLDRADPEPVEKALTELEKIYFSPVTQPAEAIFTRVQELLQEEPGEGADLYYYSDFRKGALPEQQEAALLNHIRFHAMPVRSGTASNIFIDTAFLAEPVLRLEAENLLVVRSRIAGAAPENPPALQLSINGQVKNIAAPTFGENGVSLDTLSFFVTNTGWQQILLTIHDTSIPFDDTFRIAARTSPELSVLVLNQGPPNPFLQAALKSFPGFRMMQYPIENAPASWENYNLLIFQNVTALDPSLTDRISAALNAGQSICIFPGKDYRYTHIDQWLNGIAGIRVTGIDSAAKSVTTLYQGNPLLRDIFADIPENIQLPAVSWYYQTTSSLDANRQTVFSFQNGDPLLAQYSVSSGTVYFYASAIDASSGNFQSSYFFVPFLYRMASHSKGSDIYAATAGSAAPFYIPSGDADIRNPIRLYAPGTELIPRQHRTGAGISVQAANSIYTPGYYILTPGNTDTTLIALNQEVTASSLDFPEIAFWKKHWQGPGISWEDPEKDPAFPAAPGTSGRFPLWKVCLILALLMLVAETIILLTGHRKKTAVTPS